MDLVARDLALVPVEGCLIHHHVSCWLVVRDYIQVATVPPYPLVGVGPGQPKYQGWPV